MAKKLPYRLYRRGRGWQAVVYTGPTRHRRSFYARADAERWAAGLRADYQRQRSGAAPLPTDLTLLEVAGLWLTDVETTREPPTYRYYCQRIRPVTDALGSLPVATLGRAAVSDWIARQTRDVSATNARKSLGALQRCLRWAIAHELLEASPVLAVSAPAAGPTHRIHVLSMEELERAAARASTWKRRGILLLAGHAGLRLHEVQCCERDWIDLRRNVLEVPSSAQFRPKGKLPRVIPLSPALASWAAAWPEGRRFLLEGLRDEQQIRRAVRWAATLLGRRVTEHLLRHSLATWLAGEGTPLAEIQAILGHAQISTTARYIQASGIQLERSRRLLSRRIGGGGFVAVGGHKRRQTATISEEGRTKQTASTKERSVN